ncbi:MAG: hypothetical protein M0R46_07240 [Candidatus Muirbacterium halophilum]|nr:hypothetical protein [Candidatus Muirbacterium halophilum]
MKKYKRFLVLLFIFFILAIFSAYYINIYSDIHKIYSYESNMGFFNIALNNENLFIIDEKYNIIKLNVVTKDFNIKKLEIPKCINLLKKPYACEIISKKDLKAEKSFIKYSDSFDEYFGIYTNPFWDIDNYLIDEKHIIMSKKTPSIYFEYNNKINHIIEKYKDSNIVQKQDHTLYEVDATKKSFIDERKGIYISVADKDLNNIYSNFIEFEKIDDIKNIALSSVKNILSFSFIKDNSCFSFFSYNNGRTFVKKPVINTLTDGEKHIFESGGNLYIVIDNNKLLSLYKSENNGLSFNLLNSFNNLYKIQDYAINNNYFGFICSNNSRDYLFVYDLKDKEKPVFCYGNILPASLNNLLFDDEKIIFQEQISDNKFYIYKKNFKQ